MKFEYLLLKKGCENNIIYDKKVFLNSKIARKDFKKGDILFKCKPKSIFFSDNWGGWTVKSEDVVARYVK